MPRIGITAITLASIIAFGWFAQHGAPSIMHATASTATVESGVAVEGHAAEDRSLSPRLRDRGPETIVVSGTVVDELGSPVGSAEVVLRGASGESTTISEASGEYAIAIAPGTYHVFVRDDVVMTVGHMDGGDQPAAEIASLPDENLMPVIVATAGTHDLEVVAVHGGAITGRVLDDDGNPIEGALVHAYGRGSRPALGTDIAESDIDGSFELRVPTGGYRVEVSHPRFAAGGHYVEVAAREVTTFTLSKGCAISGRVVGADGASRGDGIIEQLAEAPDHFVPAGRVEPDGAFRVTTTSEGPITLRAGPSRSTASAEKTFECHDGARYPNVVFTVAAAAPDVGGTVVDANGAPVPLAVVNLVALDEDLADKQVRTDSNGRWQIYDASPGRYAITATARGRGVAMTEFAAPKRDLTLKLGATGRIEGTTTTLVNGSFELALDSCGDSSEGDDRTISLAHDIRVVMVTGGHFAIDRVPTCQLTFTTRWHGETCRYNVEVQPDQAADVELDMGPPQAKTVHGVVLDDSEHPIPDVHVTATLEGVQSDEVTTDGSGHYLVHAFSGSIVVAGDSSRRVSTENTDDEELNFYLY